MEEQNINGIEDLLLRYCEGDVTEEEYQLVENWVNASEENERVAKQVFSIHFAIDSVQVLKKIDTEKALKKVSSRIVAKKRQIGWEWLQRAAAILFIPLLVSFLMQHFFIADTKEQVAQLIEIRTNPGMITSVILPDSTVVYLNSESSLSYPSRFDGNTREVFLKGEAYFEVMKDPSKRFLVSTMYQSQIEVLGTHFNVEAYEGGENIVTTLVEGKVNFLFKQNERAHAVKLKPGEKLTYNSKEGRVRLSATSCESETSWKDGKVILKNTPLWEALHMLQKRYNVQFVINNRKGLDDTFNGTFTNERLERILDHFKISSKIRWRQIEDANILDRKIKIEIY